VPAIMVIENYERKCQKWIGLYISNTIDTFSLNLTHLLRYTLKINATGRPKKI